MTASPAWLRETWIIDGLDHGTSDVSLGDPTLYPATTLFTKVSFGATQFDSNNTNDFSLRNISIGSSFGASDIWLPTLTGAIVPPFDSYFGTPGDMTVSGGVITVANAGFESYGLHAFASGLRELYLQFDVRLQHVMVVGVVFSSPFFSLWNQLDNELSGIYNQASPFFNWVTASGGFTPGPVENTWITIQYHVQIVGGQDGITFDGMPSHKVAA